MPDLLTADAATAIGSSTAQPGGPTRFGALGDRSTGGVQAIADDPKRYVFSNIFRTAESAGTDRRTVVAVNQEYVLEVMRLDGAGPWWAAAHDEFALVMEGTVEVALVRPEQPQVAEGADGAHRLTDRPAGPLMGTVDARRGHMVLLPAGSGYRFESSGPAVLLIQTVRGPHSEQRWSEICQTV